MNVAIQFVKESYYELKKSSWLTRKEAIDSTRAVVVIVALMSLFIAGIDFVLSVLMSSIMGH